MATPAVGVRVACRRQASRREGIAKLFGLLTLLNLLQKGNSGLSSAALNSLSTMIIILSQ